MSVTNTVNVINIMSVTNTMSFTNIMSVPTIVKDLSHPTAAEPHFSFSKGPHACYGVYCSFRRSAICTIL
jgi:hypothetical protein